MIETSTSIKHIAAALFKFQGAVDGVGKDSKNPAFKSKYASLEAVHDTAVPELQKVGVVYLQSPGAIVDGNMEMATRLIHVESGEWIEGKGDIPLGKRDPQGAGSAQTYAQRYHLMALLGLPPIDDDGEAAMDRTTATKPKAQSRDAYAELQVEVDTCSTLDELAILWTSKAFQTEFKALPTDWQGMLTEHKDARKVELSAKPSGAFVPPQFEALA